MKYWRLILTIIISIGILIYASRDSFESPEFRSERRADGYIRTNDNYWIRFKDIKRLKVSIGFYRYHVKAYVSGIGYTIADNFESAESANQWLDNFLKEKQ